ncbi:hypothetical protein PsorP6_013326 [Peronosclerospora sorghi]|uniref:Uncharacterized protein n=1 Tax=Peronosclerospora sorghi TaxID=230839 RepID=A0ACC0WER1_9STRA|nr:hypothetical protein PsorP6_013326 [Peronosclerospora sorghi]
MTSVGTLSATKRMYLFVLLATISQLTCIIGAHALSTTSTATRTSQQNKHELRSSNSTEMATDLEERTRGQELVAAAATSIMHAEGGSSGTNKLKDLLQKHPFDESILKSSEYQAWASAVREKYGGQALQVTEAKIPALTSEINIPEVARVIALAKQGEATKETADRLEKALLKSWTDEKKSIEDVFVLLKLDEKDDHLLENPVLKLWFTYGEGMENVNLYEWLIERLRTRLSYEEVAKPLMLFLDVDKKNDMAVKLKDALVKKWEHELDQMIDTLAVKGTPNLSPTDWYLGPRHFNAQYEWMVQRFSEKNADARLAQLLADLKVGKDKAKILWPKLYALQKQEWRRRGKGMKDVYEILIPPPDNPFESPLLSTWVSYAHFLKGDPYLWLYYVLYRSQSENENKVAMVLSNAAKAGKNTETIEKLQKLQEKWKKEGDTPAEVFKKFLKLDTLKVGLDTLKNEPMQRFWSKWLLKLPEEKLRNPNNLKTIHDWTPEFEDEVVSELIKILPVKKLLQFFIEAKQIDEMKTFTEKYSEKVLRAVRPDLKPSSS